MAKKKDMMPAIPPEDYKGSVGKWMTALQERGLWDGKNPEWHGDLMIPAYIWWEILEELED
jgi:hypothetical protein